MTNEEPGPARAAAPSAAPAWSDLRFLLPKERTNLPTAFGGAALVHATFVLLLLLASLRPARQILSPALEFDATRLVFLDVLGSGGGGGGGGNRSPEPPQTIETPPAKPPEPVAVAVPEPEPIPNPVVAVEIPAISPVHAPAVLASAVNLAPTSLGPGRDVGAGTGERGGIGPGLGPGLGPGRDGNIGGDVFRVGSGVVSPKLVSSPKPFYTEQGMLRRIQGMAEFDCVVTDRGSVQECKLVKSLDGNTYGLDEEAQRTAERFRFLPGTRAGEPVAVWVRIQIVFNMR